MPYGREVWRDVCDRAAFRGTVRRLPYLQCARAEQDWLLYQSVHYPEQQYNHCHCWLVFVRQLLCYSFTSLLSETVNKSDMTIAMENNIWHHIIKQRGPDVAHVAPRLIAGCCQLINLMPWFQSQCTSILEVWWLQL